MNDARSGTLLELVIPTKNELDRIRVIHSYYKECCDIVVLDDCPSIEFEMFCRESGVTLFLRAFSSDNPEIFLPEYLSEYSASKKVFWFYADEFVAIDDLLYADNALSTHQIVRARRIDYLYADEWSNSQGGLDVRGVIPEGLNYDSTRLHGSFSIADGARVAESVVNVYHLHPIVIPVYLGTPGRYAQKEFELLAYLSSPKILWKRFIKPIAGAIVRYVFREKRRSMTGLVYMLSVRLIYLLAGILVATQRTHQIKKWDVLFAEMASRNSIYQNIGKKV
ncbi:hypothetical protein [Niveibacterium terrae]|uniref:hypothetical protein n=1 Tax=Niveibacterium terrae TaxID=3373598 RepID=UPI003A91BCD4